MSRAQVLYIWQLEISSTMTKVYKWQFKIRSYEVDQTGIVSPAVFQNLLEETALQASAANGFSTEWHSANQCTWVIRRMSVRYEEPARFHNLLEARSWVSTFGRVRSNREYELVRAQDGVRVLRGRADWVFMNTTTRRIQRIPSEFETAFEPDPDTAEDLGIRLDEPQTDSQAAQYVMQRMVSRSEIDELGHVNNAHYFRWTDDAMWQALRQVKWDHHIVLRPIAHDIEYVRETRWGDEVNVTSQLSGIQDDRMAWAHIITHANGELVARDYAVWAVLDADSEHSVEVPSSLSELLWHG